MASIGASTQSGGRSGPQWAISERQQPGRLAAATKAKALKSGAELFRGLEDRCETSPVGPLRIYPAKAPQISPLRSYGASVEMTKERFGMARTIGPGMGKPRISPLRSYGASVEMTKERPGMARTNDLKI